MPDKIRDSLRKFIIDSWGGCMRNFTTCH